jgi:hypothetical protein
MQQEAPQKTSELVTRPEVSTPREAAASRAPTLISPSEWIQWSDEQLLRTRICDLDIRIEGSDLESRITQLYQELRDHNIVFRPYFWLSTEWFTPEDVTGVAVPFYMAHPRLARLELSQMLEVEGGDAEWCMRILRHETGHAIEHAFRLNRRRKRQQIFGKSSEPYPEFYTPRRYSKSFVVHLQPSYAQSHPDEDFAETFAVWLTPEAFWRKRYAGWRALRKLEYIDALMREVGPKKPLVVSRRRVEPIRRIRKTLGDHYREKRERYGLDYPNFYDQDLRRLFSNAPEYKGSPSAARFLSRVRKSVRRVVARWTGEYQYTIDQVLDDIITRCRELRLRLVASEEQTTLDFTIVLTVQTMNYIHSGRQRVWL